MTIKNNLALLVTFFVLASVSHATEPQNSPAPEYSSAPIINGSAGSVSTYPWMVFLADPFGEQFCGASLISETWVLTAAHCFVNEAGDAIDIETGAQSVVVMNSDTVSPLGSEAEQGQIGQIIIHPNYDPSMETSANVDDFDIALVELTAAVSFQPVKLLSGSAAEVAAGTQTLIMGWGTTEVDQDNMSINPSNELLVANQQIVSRTDCELVYEGGITDNMICAGDIEAGGTSDTCQGDSGGPMVVANGNDFVQLGIVSFGGTQTGPACGDPDAPGVYAKISALASFISDNVTDAQFVILGETATPDPEATAPVLSVAVEGNQVSIAWTEVAAATGYRLYYAPSPAQTPIESLDMGTALSISGELPSGSSFFVAIEPYNAAGALPEISNVEVFTVE